MCSVGRLAAAASNSYTLYSNTRRSTHMLCLHSRSEGIRQLPAAKTDVCFRFRICRSESWLHTRLQAACASTCFAVTHPPPKSKLQVNSGAQPLLALTHSLCTCCPAAFTVSLLMLAARLSRTRPMLSSSVSLGLGIEPPWKE
jgi:hypothetical protein